MSYGSEKASGHSPKLVNRKVILQRRGSDAPAFTWAGPSQSPSDALSYARRALASAWQIISSMSEVGNASLFDEVEVIYNRTMGKNDPYQNNEIKWSIGADMRSSLNEERIIVNLDLIENDQLSSVLIGIASCDNLVLDAISGSEFDVAVNYHRPSYGYFGSDDQYSAVIMCGSGHDRRSVKAADTTSFALMTLFTAFAAAGRDYCQEIRASQTHSLSATLRAAMRADVWRPSAPARADRAIAFMKTCGAQQAAEVLEAQ